MKVAYADPPYIGCAHLYPEKEEVDHVLLIARLQEEFDAWALSCNWDSLEIILPLCPEGYRMGAWVKPFASFKPNVNPAYTWEPVIFFGGRPYTREALTVRDHVSANITLQKGVVGAKPEAFCVWMFRMLNIRPEDEFVDLFPGSGGVTEAWKRFAGQMDLLAGIV